MDLEKQLLQGALASRQLQATARSPQTGGLSRLVATFRARRQGNRNADLLEALKQKEEQTRSRIIGQLEPEQRPLAEEVDTGTLKKMMEKRLEASFDTPEEIQPLSPEGKRQRDLEKGFITPQQVSQFEGIEQQSSFQKEQAKALGKARGTDINRLQTFEANFPELESTVARLEELSDVASFGIADVSKDAITRQTTGKPSKGAIARAEFDSITKNVIFPLLSQTFKGTISDSEREALLSTLADKNLSPKEKKAQMKAFVSQKKNEIKSLRRKLGVGQEQKTQIQPTVQFNEGQTATNPQTGEKMIFKGGQWQKM